ncbi:MAG: aminoacyl-tRNA hydrolase [Candidatus Doudnabacteria bacterium]|nr:aminoacyl-tRNA hydrolase [Candidatus Doudnabacteria bacterium]
MKLIVGLGNPGKKYEYTRHNAGFLAIDHYLKSIETISCSSKFNGQICEVHFHAQTEAAPIKTFFIKPQTFMNRSGEAVAQVVQFYKANPETDLLVIHDEIDLKFGYYKVAFNSRPAGHNGVKNIVETLQSQRFTRIRIGIESRMSRMEAPIEEYVLSRFTETELSTLAESVFPQVSDAITQFIQT